MPLAFQYNKRDLAAQGIRLLPLEKMEQDLNRQLKAPAFAASAVNGVGVGKTLHDCLKQTLIKLQREFRWAG